MKRLISDGGEMTVGRRTASWVWGRFDVTLADGDTSAAADDRIVDGYVYRPDDRQLGLFDLTFVRADARLDMNAEQSDLEATLDGASRRTEGGAFHTKTISGDGLARTRPGVDYRRGDMVEVLVWGKTMELPVTGITATSSLDNPLGWEVQVGGQLVRDAEALRKRNSDLAAQIAAEKRQRMRETGEIRTAVDAEQDARIDGMNIIVDRLGRLYADMTNMEDAYREYRPSRRWDLFTTDIHTSHLAVRRVNFPEFTCGHTGTYDFNLSGVITPTGEKRNLYWSAVVITGGSLNWGDEVSGTKTVTGSGRMKLYAGKSYSFGAVQISSSVGDHRTWRVSDVNATVSLVPGGE